MPFFYQQGPRGYNFDKYHKLGDKIKTLRNLKPNKSMTIQFGNKDVKFTKKDEETYTISNGGSLFPGGVARFNEISSTVKKHYPTNGGKRRKTKKNKRKIKKRKTYRRKSKY